MQVNFQKVTPEEFASMVKDPYTFYKIVLSVPDVTAQGYSGTYDGQPHSISVTSDGSTITYSTDGVQYSSTKPTYTNAGTYTVYYKVEKTGYQTVTGSETVAISKANPTLTLVETSTNVFTVSTSSDGEWTKTSSGTTGCSASIDGDTIVLHPGGKSGQSHTLWVTVTVPATNNYNSTSLSNEFTWDGDWNRSDTGWH